MTILAVALAILSYTGHTENVVVTLESLAHNIQHAAAEVVVLYDIVCLLLPLSNFWLRTIGCTVTPAEELRDRRSGATVIHILFIILHSFVWFITDPIAFSNMLLYTQDIVVHAFEHDCNNWRYNSITAGITIIISCITIIIVFFSNSARFIANSRTGPFGLVLSTPSPLVHLLLITMRFL
jgi:hypothetical protein